MKRIAVVASGLVVLSVGCTCGPAASGDSASSSGGAGPTSSGTAAGSGNATGSSSTASSGSNGSTGSTGDTSAGASGTTGGGKSRLECDPPSLDFGNVVINSTATKLVTLSNSGTAIATAIVKDISGDDAHLFSAGLAPAALDAGAAAQVQVTFAPVTLETSSEAFLDFSDSEGPQTSVTLTGTPVGVSASLGRNPIVFGYVPLDAGVVACTTVTAWANLAVTIAGITNFADENGAFALSQVDDSTPPQPAPVPVTIDAGDSAQVCFSLTPEVEQQYEGQVTLQTNDVSGVNPILQLVGFGGGPQISCDAEDGGLDFGGVTVGQSSTKTVLCTNAGTALQGIGLIIGKPSASPSVFTAACDPSTNPCPDGGLAPGDSAQIDVTYKPTAQAADQGTLLVPSNGGQGKTVSIALTGQGD